MLSRQERQTLAAIEFRLVEEAPQLATQFRKFDNGEMRPESGRMRRLLFGMMLFLAGLALVCGLSGLVLGGVVTAMLATLIGGALLYSSTKSGEHRPR